jgi:hypothetical protein
VAAAAAAGGSDLEQLVAAGKRERSQLLRHLIAKGDELDALQRDLAAIRTELAARSQPNTRETESPRTLRTLAVALAIAAAATVLAVGLYERFVVRPSRVQLEMEASRLSSQLLEATRSVEALKADVAARDLSLKTASTTVSNPEPPVVQKSTDPDAAAAQKALATRAAALDEEERRLTQMRRDLDLERQQQGDARKVLDDDRAALQKRIATLPQAAPSPVPEGVLIWRADVTVPTAVLITGNKANYGVVTGGMPTRPATMKLDVIEGDVKVLDAPGPKNNWNQLYLQVLGKGRVTVFLLWVAR